LRRDPLVGRSKVRTLVQWSLFFPVLAGIAKAEPRRELRQVLRRCGFPPMRAQA
jgi:hypothetical protein